MQDRPASGLTMPMIALNSVDLPEPFMPTRPQIRPGSTVSDARVERQDVAVVDGDVLAPRIAGSS